MFIQTEDTPNPNSLKFLPGHSVVPGGGVVFNNAQEAQRSPLAHRLLKIAGLEAVYFGEDFITVTKSSQSEWGLLKPLILTEIMEHFVTGLPVIEEAASTDDDEETDPLIKQIKALIETRIRPAVAMDGGDIVFDRFEDGIVFLHLRGACSGCPSSTATLKTGIESLLKHYVPEVIEVRATE